MKGAAVSGISDMESWQPYGKAIANYGYTSYMMSRLF